MKENIINNLLDAEADAKAELEERKSELEQLYAKKRKEVLLAEKERLKEVATTMDEELTKSKEQLQTDVNKKKATSEEELSVYEDIDKKTITKLSNKLVGEICGSR